MNSACGFANAKAPGFEADDFLASAAAREEKRDGTVLVASGDRDTFQLASARTTILFPVRAGEMARIDQKEVRVRYGVDPAHVKRFAAESLNVVKLSYPRIEPQGGVMERDMHAGQQFVRLLEVELS